ncbi:hypothetical protein [Spirosoma sp. 48-14]|uniref:hypothetical protein n=1 Tax=Spirosoma sp. 48-14 TaxID=1895854 RepID=UPI00096491C5|nr:hypothetical protein [Spirosoma sp. 48-14]OJW76291.1 MAG: hypothetical protein BGO59_22495 [Spirosoma sp. 48-14]
MGYKSGDVVGVWQTGHYEGSIFGREFVAETYTWRVRYIADYDVWILTATTSLPNWNGHEVVQSATYLNQWKDHFNADFATSNYVNLLADNKILSKMNLSNEQQLGDNYTRDNSTPMPDPGPNGLVKQNTTPTPTPIGSQFNTTYILIGAIVIVIALIMAKRK